MARTPGRRIGERAHCRNKVRQCPRMSPGGSGLSERGPSLITAQCRLGLSVNNSWFVGLRAGLWYGVGMADGTGELLAAKFEAVFPHLGERQRRLLMGAEARVLGHGGVRVVAPVAGVPEAPGSLGGGGGGARAGTLGPGPKPGHGRQAPARPEPRAWPPRSAL